MSRTTSSLPERITSIILAKLEQGVPPWRQPWSNLVGPNAHHNPISRHAYRGINRWLLAIVAEERGYTDTRWVTFNQARERGGHVRAGERSTPVIFWKQFQVKHDEVDGSGDITSVTKTVPMLRHYAVFNAAQCEDLRLTEVSPGPEVTSVEPIEACEAIINGYADRPPTTRGGNRASYNPQNDAVRIPQPEQFNTPQHFYSTWFHEHVHGTGHPQRLNRATLTGFERFADHAYSREELVAEFGASMLAAHAGIERVTLGESASYIDHWRRFLLSDPRAVIVAASAAEKAYEYILGASAPMDGSRAEREPEAVAA